MKKIARKGPKKKKRKKRKKGKTKRINSTSFY